MKTKTITYIKPTIKTISIEPFNLMSGSHKEGSTWVSHNATGCNNTTQTLEDLEKNDNGTCP